MDHLATLTTAARQAAHAYETLERQTVEARREQVLAFGRALSAIRKLIPSKNLFAEHLAKHALAIRTPGWRSDAIWLADQQDDLLKSVSQCPYSNPTDIRTWLRQQQTGTEPAKPKRRTTKAGESEVTRKVREYVRPLIERGEPLSVQEVAKASGHSRIVSEAAIAFERGRVNGLKEAADLAPIDMSALPKTAQEKLAAFERRIRSQLETELEHRVRDEVRTRLAQRDEADDLVVAQARELIARHHTRPFSVQEFYKIMRALHPDTSTPENRTEAFTIVRPRKLLLCDDGPIKRKSDDARPLPKTVDELLALRRGRKNLRPEAMTR